MPLPDLGTWHAELQAIGWTLLDFFWQGALVLVVYAIARAIWRADPAARLSAGYVALLSLAAAPVVTLAIRWPSSAATYAAERTLVDRGSSESVFAAAATPDWMPWVVSAWATGVLLLASRAVWQWHALRGICASARPLDPAWQQRLAALGKRFGLQCSLTVLESARIGAPSLIGWLKPVVLLPAGMALRLPQAQIELVLAHEIAHLRRHDHLANLLQVVLETGLFYHPAVHWISRTVREDREQCCDDLVAEVCGSRLDYARALLSIAELRSTLPRLAIAAGGGQLLARVERIVGVDRARPRPLNERLLLGLAIGATILLGLQALATREQALPLPWEASTAFDRQRLPTPVLGLRIGELATPRPRPAMHVPAPPVAPESVSSARDEATMLPVTGSAQRAAGPAIPIERTPLPVPALDVSVSIPPRIQRPFAAATAMSQAAPTIIQPIRSHAPEYPGAATLRGTEGSVELSFVIDARGRATEIRVESAEPAGTFDRAAERALQRWRFAPADAGPLRHSRTFDFRLKPPEGKCMTPGTGSRVCRPSS
jgi:bla regulator protein blaR1